MTSQTGVELRHGSEARDMWGTTEMEFVMVREHSSAEMARSCSREYGQEVVLFDQWKFRFNLSKSSP